MSSNKDFLPLSSLLFFLNALSSAKSSFRSFPFHDELLKRTSSFKECKINLLRMEEPAAILLTSEQISPAITGDSNSFLSLFSKLKVISRT